MFVEFCAFIIALTTAKQASQHPRDRGPGSLFDRKKNNAFTKWITGQLPRGITPPFIIPVRKKNCNENVLIRGLVILSR